ncbi:MAG: hypothetical protein MUE66_08060 [Acidimicrobiia bacterium]|nr:hypothetical protein [Acidimicrobiia bacterium]
MSADAKPIADDFRISGPHATEGEHTPDVAWNPTTNEYLVVWEDERAAATSGSDIYGRRVSAYGRPLGDDICISGPNATSSEFTPAIAWNQAAKRYLVVWSDSRSWATRGHDIYGRLVGTDGQPIGAERRISGPDATANDRNPAVASKQSTNQFLVVWDDNRKGATRGTDIYGRRFSTTGGPVGPERRISGPAATSNEGQAAVAWNQAAHEYLVVWLDGRSLTGSSIYGHRVGADGQPLGSDVRIRSAGAPQGAGTPAVAWNHDADEYLVVWEDDRNLAARKSDVFGRRLAGDAVPSGGEFRICGPGATMWDLRPAVAWNRTAGDYLVIWEDGRINSVGGADIYGRLVAG